MAVIPPYGAKGTHAGQAVTVKARKFIWLPVGQGTVQSFSDYDVKVAGSINILGFNGMLNINLQLLDREPAATTGPCILHLNSHVDKNATYQAHNGTLTVKANFGAKKQSITILPRDNGRSTECQLSGYVSETVQLEPR
jgi:hypothetical protein